MIEDYKSGRKQPAAALLARKKQAGDALPKVRLALRPGIRAA